MSAEEKGTGGVVSHRAVLAIAVPIMFSNLSTPLLGVVDTAVIGRIPDPALIGSVALGALVFTFVFWAFGFLRMGTTGLTAQAFGGADADEVRASLGRALLIAMAAGAALIALQWPIREAAFALIEGGSRVEALAQDYYDVRIWAAPATLMNYALLGWFIGLGRAGTALVLQLVLNLTNMLLDAWFVLVLEMGVRGVALGTVLAECLAAAVGMVLAVAYLRRSGGRWDFAQLVSAARIRRTVVVNSDIMIRSLALVFVFVWFMAQGAKHGDVILASNAVLMHFISVSAYFLDGLAFAAEALVGRAVGAGRRAGLSAAARMTTWWAASVALLCALLIALFGGEIIDLMTVEQNVRATARIYLPWAALAPLAGVWCFQLDGIFIGATRTADMRNAMLISTAIFLAAWYALTPLENHGLWAALYINYVARTATLFYFYPGLVRSVPA